MLGLPFDPQAEIDQWTHNRPHWAQAGVLVYITFRTRDSIPGDVVKRWDSEKKSWLLKHGIHAMNWRAGLELAPHEIRQLFAREFHRTREVFLDTCQGECLMRRPEIASIVANSLFHFNGKKYELGDFVVMPNHVHLLVVFPDPLTMKNQCTSWLRFTATEINRISGRQGAFWQEEPFDHLVRHGDQYNAIRQYIACNPEKAHLKPGEYFYYRRPD